VAGIPASRLDAGLAAPERQSDRVPSGSGIDGDEELEEAIRLAALAADDDLWIPIPLDDVSSPTPPQQMAPVAAAAGESESAPLGARARRRLRGGPVEDEWGLFDPEQCGFAALVAKLDEVTAADEEQNAAHAAVRVISCS
jgi:hypothetical protein